MLWFTLGRGIVTEVYHPWLDHAAIRDLGFIVTALDGFASEETNDCVTDVRTVATGNLAYQIRNRCNLGSYESFKQIIADLDRSVLLQRVTLKPLRGKLQDYCLFVLSLPRLGNQGQENSGWTGSFNGQEILFARHESHCLALAHSSHWMKRSVGYVGTMGRLCSQTGLLPEQVWDSPDIPGQHLFFGRPSGSAMPLAWTHSEYVRLLRSLRDKKFFDLPIDSHEGYVRQKTKSDFAFWCFDH